MVLRMGLGLCLSLCLGLGVAGSGRASAAEPGQPAPAFRLSDLDGKSHSLADGAGKYVVLEWTNLMCPYVGKHYRSGNMQAMQRDYTAMGVLWFTLNSSAPGKLGHCTPTEWRLRAADWRAVPTAILLDPDGVVGKAYGARTTPQVFIIDPKGALVYTGPVDDRPSTDPEDIPGALNYVREVLDAGLAGIPLAPRATMPYGCSIKY